MKLGSIHQIIQFNTTAERVYEMVMDERIHSKFTESLVTMSREIKGEFLVFDGYCTGYNRELIPGEKIVQAWHFEEDGWPQGHFSECTFIFKNTGQNCQLDFKQTGIPEHKVEALTEGWKSYYWEPMKSYLDSEY